MRHARLECGKCGHEAEPSRLPGCWAIQVGEQWISRFSYPGTGETPAETKALLKAWEASEGIRQAQCCKAHLGDVPYLWPNTVPQDRSGVDFVAAGGYGKPFGGVVRWICGSCSAVLSKGR
jgi:hypothetical protein